MRFRVLIEPYSLWALEGRTVHQVHQADLWWNEQQDWVRDAQSNTERGERQKAAVAERAEKVRTGQLVFSRADVVRLELRGILDELGWWKKRFPEVKAGVAEAPGRRWGATNREFHGHFHVDVDDRTGALLRRGTYHLSEQARTSLRAWYDRHGRGPAHAADLPPSVQGLYLMVCAMKGITADQLEERDGWREMTLTPADILRRAAYRAGEGYEPQGPRPKEPVDAPVVASA
ncbi:MAG: hypothetical protein ABIQ18_31965 [Umezawaea sp.]